jgi:hypothetical protein
VKLKVSFRSTADEVADREAEKVPELAILRQWLPLHDALHRCHPHVLLSPLKGNGAHAIE